MEQASRDAKASGKSSESRELAFYCYYPVISAF